MNSAQSQLRLQKAREVLLEHKRRRSFDETTFETLQTAQLWLCAADKTKACHLTALAESNGAVSAALKEDKAKDEHSVTWFIYHKDKPTEQIGSIWLFQFSSSGAKIATAMIGYTLSETARGRGYMSEALGAVSQFAFEKLGLQKIEARIRISNERSKAVVQRAGFKPTTIVRKGKWGLGEYQGIEIVELEVWILSKAEWQARLQGSVNGANL
jgi:RimJ/RimL family protein N-acetyltransferase